MGACVSSHHKSSLHITSGSNRKPDNHNVIPPSRAIKQQLHGNVPVKPQLPPLKSTDDSIDFGSKDETFFDSQAWLESDCEYDFMSVNGDFTPSRGNTPVHHNFRATKPPIKGGAPAIDGLKLSTVSQPCPTPVKKTKRLSELFSESQRENRNYDEENGEHTNENGPVGSLEAAVVHDSVLKPKREGGRRLFGFMGAYRGCFLVVGP